MNVLRKKGGNTCPICRDKEETITHMLKCQLQTNNTLKRDLQEALIVIDIEPHIFELIMHCIKAFRADKDIKHCTRQHPLWASGVLYHVSQPTSHRLEKNLTSEDQQGLDRACHHWSEPQGWIHQWQDHGQIHSIHHNFHHQPVVYGIPNSNGPMLVPIKTQYGRSGPTSYHRSRNLRRDDND